MIKTFADNETQKLFVSGKSKRLPSDLLRRAIRRLEFIHFANDINDLLVPPSNRLHALKGDRKGQHSISINDQWRICFRFIEGDAYDVKLPITIKEKTMAIPNTTKRKVRPTHPGKGF